MKRPRSFLPLVLLAVLGLAGLGLSQTGLAFNFTPSLPVGVYRRAELPPDPGVLVSVCVAEHVAREARRLDIVLAGNCPGGVVPLLKRIAAVAGETVEITAQGVFISGHQLQPPASARNASGERLTTWPLGRYELAPGQLWLTADHPRSWDSRYFGPIDAEAIRGTYRPLWTWNP